MKNEKAGLPAGPNTTTTARILLLEREPSNVALLIACAEARTRQVLHRLQQARHLENKAPASVVIEAALEEAERFLGLALKSVDEARTLVAAREAASRAQR